MRTRLSDQPAHIERIHVPRSGVGRPRCRPDQVIADKAYSSRSFRTYLRKRGIAHTIPEKTDQQRHRHNRGRDGGPPPAFDRHRHRRRHVVERCFNRLNSFRGIATRYEKTATSYEAAVALRLKTDPRRCFSDHVRSQMMSAARVTVPR
ncbi:transposase [Streptomyces sp. NPDC053750]|uniref:transposase n=1 Tax=Streptomyces sp. NPDC053750 TaxID=3365714 RepID=UPI0037D1AF80